MAHPFASPFGSRTRARIPSFGCIQDPGIHLRYTGSEWLNLPNEHRSRPSRRPLPQFRSPMPATDPHGLYLAANHNWQAEDWEDDTSSEDEPIFKDLADYLAHQKAYNERPGGSEDRWAGTRMGCWLWGKLHPCKRRPLVGSLVSVPRPPGAGAARSPIYPSPEPTLQSPMHLLQTPSSSPCYSPSAVWWRSPPLGPCSPGSDVVSPVYPPTRTSIGTKRAFSDLRANACRSPSPAPRGDPTPSPPWKRRRMPTLKEEIIGNIHILQDRYDPAQIRKMVLPWGSLWVSRRNFKDWVRRAPDVIDKWLDEGLYPGMALTEARRMAGRLARACLRRVKQKLAGKPLRERKRTRTAKAGPPRPKVPPKPGTRLHNVGLLDEAFAEWPQLATKGYKRGKAAAIGKLVVDVLPQVKAMNEFWELYPDTDADSPQHETQPPAENTAVECALCLEWLVHEVAQSFHATAPVEVLDIIDDYRVSMEEWEAAHDRVFFLVEDLAEADSEYENAVQNDSPYHAAQILRDHMEVRVDLLPLLPEGTYKSAVDVVVTAKVQEDMETAREHRGLVVHEVDELFRKFPPATMLIENDKHVRDMGYDTPDLQLHCSLLTMRNALQVHPFDEYEAASKDVWLEEYDEQAEAFYDDRPEVDEERLHSQSPVVSHDGSQHGVLRLRGGGVNFLASDQDHAIIQRVVNDQAIITTEAQVRMVIEAFARAAADEIGMDSISGQTALTVLREAAVARCPIAVQALQWHGQFFNLDRRELDVVAVVRLRSGALRTIRSSMANLSDRERTHAEALAAMVDNLVMDDAVRQYPDDAFEDTVSVSAQRAPCRVRLEDVLMQGITLHSRLWATLNPVDFGLRDGVCVLDYIIQQVVSRKRDINHLQDGLDDVIIRREFATICDVSNGISVAHIDQWLRDFQHNIGYFALDPVTMEVFREHHTPGIQEVTLTFVVAHNHCYPITSPALRARIFANKELDKLECGFLCADTDNFVFMANSPENVERIVGGADVLAVPETVIYTDADLEALVYTVAAVHHQIPDQLQLRAGKLDAFVHPVTLQIVKRAEDWHLRKAVCDALFAKYRTEDFHWRGTQTWGVIGRRLARITAGKLLASSHCDPDTFDAYNSVPLVQRLDPRDDGVAIDCKRCYTRAVYGNTEPWLVFSVMDEIEVWDGVFVPNGEYYVQRAQLRKELCDIVLPAQIMCYSYVKWLVGNEFMDRDRVTHQRIALQMHPAGTFMQLIQTLQELESTVPGGKEGKIAKTVFNRFIGYLNIRHDTDDFAYMCLDYEEAMCHYIRQRDMGREVNIVGANMPHVNLCIIRATEKRRRVNDTGPLWNQVVGNASLLVLQKAVAVVRTSFGRLVGIKTDALMFDNLALSDIVLGESWQPEEFNPPRISWRPKRTHPVTLTQPWVDIVPAEFTLQRSCVVIGPGGSGKTHLVMAAVDECKEEVLCLAYTNAAVNNMRNKTDGQAPNVTYRTITSVLFSIEKKTFDMTNYDVLVLDELSMVNTQDMTKLMAVAPAVRIIIGDYNQVPPVQSGLAYKFTDKRVFRQFVDHRRLQMAFNPLFGRYDLQTQACLEHFLQHSRLHPMMATKHLNPALRRNIVYTNKEAEKIIRRLAKDLAVGDWVRFTGDEVGGRVCVDRVTGFVACAPQEREPERVAALQYTVRRGNMVTLFNDQVVRAQGNVTRAEFQPGDEVVGRYNSMRHPRQRLFKEHLFFNSCLYVVEVVSPKGYFLEGVDCEIPSEVLSSGVAVTTHRYQGNDCPHPYNIWELEKMTKELLYTAMSRTTRYEDIHLQFTDREFLSERHDPRCTPAAKAVPQHMWRDTGTNAAHLLTTDDAHRAAAHLEVPQARLEYLHATYCQTERACTRTLALARNEAHERVNKLIIPLSKVNELKSLVIRKTRDKMCLTVGKERWEFRWNAGNRDRVLEQLKVLGLAAIRARYGSVGDWEYKAERANKGRQAFRLQRVPLVRVRDPWQPVAGANLGDEETIPAAERLRVRANLAQFFATRKWYNRKAVPTMQAIMKGTMVVRWGTFHMAECSRDELVQMIAMSVKRHEGQLYEDMHRNVRLCADLDMEVPWRARGIDPLQVPLDVVRVANAVALQHGVVLDFADWRFQNACTEKKLSWHVICPSQTFEILSDQLAFWVECVAVFRERDDGYVWHKEVRRSNGKRVREERCIIDTAIYKSAQPMRCIFSEKTGKGNYLLPFRWTGQELEAVPDDEVDLRFLEQHLCTGEAPLVFSPLTVSVRKVQGRKRPLSVPRDYQPLPAEEQAKLRHLRLPEGFSLHHAEKMEATVRLRRVMAGHCPCCRRVHTRDNALLFASDGHWYFRCFKPEAARICLGRVLAAPGQLPLAQAVAHAAQDDEKKEEDVESVDLAAPVAVFPQDPYQQLQWVSKSVARAMMRANNTSVEVREQFIVLFESASAGAKVAVARVRR